MDWFKKKQIFMDYASATPVLEEIKKEMDKYWSAEFYNPNAIYDEGVKVRKDVEEYRIRIARILGVAKESVVFTSGGTEANTWAVRGVKPGKIIVEPESHPSLSEAVLKNNSKEIVLISSPTVDNKLGRKVREERKKNNQDFPLLHIDASQSANYFNVALDTLACDILTLDAAKLYGPKGIGALVVRKGVKLDLPPLGTPAVPLIAGFAKALEIAARDREVEGIRLESLSTEFLETIQSTIANATITQTSPNIVNVSVPGILPEWLVLALDRKGIMISSGPACNSNKSEPPDTPVRFSFGRFTTSSDIKEAAKIFCLVCQSVVKYN